MKLKELCSEIMNKMVENRPMIVTMAAIGAAGLTGFIIFRKSPEIRDIVAESKEKIADIEEDESKTAEEKKAEIDKTKTETMKQLACPIGMIAGGAVLTVGLIWGINKAHNIKTEVLIAGYKVATGKVAGYEKILPEVLGEKKAEEVKTQVAGEVANRAAERNGFGTFIMNDDSKCICRDIFGNQWIGTYNDIEEAKNNLNADLQDCDCSLNDFYEYLPNCNRTSFGDEMIFLKENGKVSVRYSTMMDEWTHKPMIIIDYDCAPRCMNKKYIMSSDEARDRWRYGDLGR